MVIIRGATSLVEGIGLWLPGVIKGKPGARGSPLVVIGNIGGVKGDDLKT